MRTAIQACCLQLKSKIAKQQAAREQRQRKKNLTKYIPNVAAALFTVLQSVAGQRGGGSGSDGADGSEQQPGPAGKGTQHIAARAPCYAVLCHPGPGCLLPSIVCHVPVLLVCLGC